MERLAFRLQKPDRLQKLDITARRIGKTLKVVAKFLFLFLMWTLFNIAVGILFNGVRSLSAEIFRLVDNGSHVVFLQNAEASLALIKQLGVVAVTFVVLASVVNLVLKLCGNMTSAPARKAGNYRKIKYVEHPVHRMGLFSYKQHVAFLA